MPQPCLPESLRNQVLETIRKHWAAPHWTDSPQPVPKPCVEETARAALDAMLTRQFRVGPLPPREVVDQLLARVRRNVDRNQPICVTVGYGPLKNQNAVSYSRADWAEFFAMCHLVAWHNKIQAIYAPGLQIRIVFDDSTLAMANHSDHGLMRSYMSSITDLTRALKFDVRSGGPFLPSFGHSRFAWLFRFGLYRVAGWKVSRWERDPANLPQLERMLEFARRNVLLPPGLAPEAREQAFLAASHRYRVYWEALQMSGITNSKYRMIAMYLDGSQHHIRQTVALHLTTLDKGQVTQPWQGEGALLDNGHGRLEPFVLTSGRRLRHKVQMVEGLDIVPCVGFDRIAVAWPNQPATTKAAPIVPVSADVPINAPA